MEVKYDTVKNIINNSKRYCIFLQGNSGACQSTLAKCIVNDIPEQNFQYICWQQYFTNTPFIKSSIKQATIDASKRCEEAIAKGCSIIYNEHNFREGDYSHIYNIAKQNRYTVIMFIITPKWTDEDCVTYSKQIYPQINNHIDYKYIKNENIKIFTFKPKSKLPIFHIQVSHENGKLIFIKSASQFTKQHDYYISQISEKHVHQTQSQPQSQPQIQSQMQMQEQVLLQMQSTMMMMCQQIMKLSLQINEPYKKIDKLEEPSKRAREE